MENQESLATAVHDVVEESANSIEEIHRKIAGLPIDLLEHVRVLKGPLKEVRKMQNDAIGTIYGVVRDVNQEVTRLAGELAEPRKRPAKKKLRAVKAKPHDQPH